MTDTLQLLGEAQLLHIAPDSIVRHEGGDQWTVTRGDVVLSFDLADSVYASGPPAWFAKQLRDAARK